MTLPKWLMEKIPAYQNNPIEFFKDAWPGIFIWDKLEEIALAVKNNRRVVVPSGHGVGKTWLMARLAIWFLYCFYPSKVITTAPTWPQVELLLWSEIRKAHSSCSFNLGGEVLQTRIKIEEDWFAVGFSTRGKASEREFGATKFQGYHSPNLLLILDEAPGVEPEIWTSASSLITGSNNRIVAIGNPTSPTGNFYEACKAPNWKKIIVSSFDHPNVKTGKIVVDGAVTREWIEDQKIEWGEGSPLWLAKILGQFPDEGEDTLIPLSWLEACVGLALPKEGDKRLGVDVARYGNDKTVFTKIFGSVVDKQEERSGKDLVWTSGRVKSLEMQNKFDFISGDDTGLGGGVTDICQDEGIDFLPFIFGASPEDTETFENLKAECFWNLREAFRDKLLSLPDDKVLINQLASIRFAYTRKGKIKIESKDEMKKRGLKSPDKAESLMIAYNAGRSKVRPSVLIIGEDDEE